MKSNREPVYWDRPFFWDRERPARNWDRGRPARNAPQPQSLCSSSSLQASCLRSQLTFSRLRRSAGGTPAVLMLFLFFVPASFGARTERLLDAWKPTNYNVALAFNNNLTEITSARAEITIVSLKDSLSNIDFDFGELAIDSVTVNNRSASYQRSAGLLNIKLEDRAPRGTTLLVVVSYHGKPKDGLILSTDKAGKPAAVGDNWPNRVHHWIPCFDHPSAKATVTFSITVPEHNQVVANGKLDRVANGAGTVRTWTYTESAPIPPYCMIIAVGDFARFDITLPNVPALSYYVPQPDRPFAMQGFGAAAPALKFFSELVAPYPYEKLALIIGATRFGGMENSSAIVFPSGLLDPRSGADQSPTYHIPVGLRDVVAHEIAHQWFGDSVTESTWSDLWLSEGFADYFAGLFIQSHEGEAAFRRYMKQEADSYLDYEKNRRAPIHDEDTQDLFKLLNANNYQKGAWVLHMLRAELGDEAFFGGIRRYYEGHKNATATSEDLRSALEATSGKDLKDFFARWVFGAGHPRYELSWRWNSKSKTIALTLKQVQTGDSFPNAVPIEISTATERRRILLNPANRQTTQEFHLDSIPTGVIIDPDNLILDDAQVSRIN
jgi:aminopeptidase N